MSANASPLRDESLARIESGWANRLAVPVSAFHQSEITFVPKEASKVLVIVELHGSVVVVSPPALIRVLSPISHPDLLDLEVLLRLLVEFQPKPVGVATISYVDSSTLRKTSSSHPVHIAQARELEEVLSSGSRDEQEESGISTIPMLFGAKSEDGDVGALAGYEVWNSKIAQMGVLAKPKYRGTGLAFAAAHAASKAAMDSELVPQWRCRIGNEPSHRLSEQLGFQKLGHQLAVDLII